MMKRIEVRDVANHGKVAAEHATEGVVSVIIRAAQRRVQFAQTDGRTVCVIPSEFQILDVTINAPGDLIMVTIERK